MFSKYNINEIFYSIQGEGYYSGIPSIFIRFQGCNLRCPFCDTPQGLEIKKIKTLLSTDDICDIIAGFNCSHIVLTGGEPLLQIQTGNLLNILRKKNYYIQIETNGTIEINRDSISLINWITCSPKKLDFLFNNFKLRLPDEIKILNTNQDLEIYNHFNIKYLQPIDLNNEVLNYKNFIDTLERVKQLRGWRLSVQLHKVLNIK